MYFAFTEQFGAFKIEILELAALFKEGYTDQRLKVGKKSRLQRG